MSARGTLRDERVQVCKIVFVSVLFTAFFELCVYAPL